MDCAVCNGSGQLLGDPCPLCDGVEPDKGAKLVQGAELTMGEEPSVEEQCRKNPAAVPGESGPDVFEAECLTVELPDGSSETYIAVKPPEAGAASGSERALRTVDALVVLDCSGSMSGRRIGAANAALQRLYACPQLESLTVIRFGSKVAPRAVFRKRDVSEIPSFQADLGTTNFIEPLQELEAALQSRTRGLSAPEPLAVFISDGQCHDRPKEAVKRLTDTLRSLDCPLMSVAITTEVQPDVMVALADAHGGLPLLLVHDSEAQSSLAEQLLEHLPLDGNHETVRVSFLRRDDENGEVVEHRDMRFVRDGTAVELLAPRGVPFSSLALAVAVLDDRGAPMAAEVRLRRLSGGDATTQEGEQDSVLCLANHGRALLHFARAALGSFIKGELPREQAEQQVMVLREAFLSRLGEAGGDEKGLVDALGGGPSKEGSRERRAELAAAIRARRAAATEVRQEFNKILAAVGRSDMRQALEAYSQQTLSAKHGKRLGQIARRNASQAPQKVDGEAALRLLRSYEAKGDAEREMAPCLLWLCNPYEAMSGFAGADQSDWVGRAVFVVPGRVAALNCWRVEQVLVRPLSITRSLISQIKVSEADGQRRALVCGTGYEEFNACLPMLSPGEHVGAVRLAIHCMRRSSEAQAALADLVCGSPELFDPAMANAAYVTAALSSLARAKSEAELDGVLRALLTLLDIASADGAADYWANLFAQLAGTDAARLVACKDMDKLPDIARAFLPLVCTDAAYAAPEAAVKSVCTKLLLRAALDQTSEKLGACAALGIDEPALLARCMDLTAAASDEALDAMVQDPSAAMSALGDPPARAATSFTLHLSKLALMYGLHMALRHAGLGAEHGLSEILDKVMDGSIPSPTLLAMLRDAIDRAVVGDTPTFVARVLCVDDGAAALADLLVVCCHGHALGAEELPRHDGKYIAACFDALSRVGGPTHQGLHALASEVRQRVLVAALRSAIEKVHFDRHKLEIIHGFAARAEAFLREHPWEAHRHEMPSLTLGFSTDQRRFAGRDELWAALQNGWYHLADLQELHALTKETVKDFDLAGWKASHRHFLPGFHIYSGKNLALSRGEFQNYLARMQRDMEDHYAGRKNRLYQREYTPKMRAWLEPYARIIFEESRVATAVQRASKDPAVVRDAAALAEEYDQQSALAALVAAVWAQFPELEALDAERRGTRRRHLEVLAREALGLRA